LVPGLKGPRLCGLSPTGPKSTSDDADADNEHFDGKTTE